MRTRKRTSPYTLIHRGNSLIRIGHLRHYSIHKTGCIHYLLAGSQYGSNFIGSRHKGKRFALPHARDASSAYRWSRRSGSEHRHPCQEIIRVKNSLNQIIQKHSGQDLKLSPGCRSRKLLCLLKKLKHGIIDDILTTRNKEVCQIDPLSGN